MTTIEYGGGPTLAQRRAFAGLKSGSHVPGYRGYCPQLKFRQGKSYGQDTHELSKTIPGYLGGKDTFHLAPRTLDSAEFSAQPLVQEGVRSKLPVATGDNKYTESMVPGYTGYIPREPFKFGATYRCISDECISEFVTNFEADEAKQADVQRAATMFPKLRPIQTDPKVKDHLNFWADSHPKHPILLTEKRGPTEPPIPGYRGYVPRIHTTELGLGCRYHEMSKNGLEVFRDEISRHQLANSASGSKVLVRTNENGGQSLSFAPPSSAGFSRRLYGNEGMVPKYTGYVPRIRYSFGNTYGDTTRSMPVCAHNASNYGEFVKTARS